MSEIESIRWVSTLERSLLTVPFSSPYFSFITVAEASHVCPWGDTDGALLSGPEFIPAKHDQIQCDLYNDAAGSEELTPTCSCLLWQNSSTTVMNEMTSRGAQCMNMDNEEHDYKELTTREESAFNIIN